MPEVLDYKTQELIALGVAYAINCTKCMKVHRREALKAGLSAQAMSAALNVAQSVVSGATGITRDEAKILFGSEVTDASCCPIGSDCCDAED